MDRLTELFANKPTSYLGPGIIYNGDTRGNGVSSSEQDVSVIPRFNQSDGGGAEDYPFRVTAAGLVTPGTVNGSMVTIDGDPLDATTNVLDMSTDGPIWLAITFTLSWTSTTPAYLSAATFSSAVIDSGASLPSNTTSVKYYQIGSITDGIATMTVRNSANALLIDGGADATTLVILAAP